MRKLFIAVVVLVGVALVGAPSQIDAQGSGAGIDQTSNCQGCWHNLDVNEHGFSGSVGYYDCNVFNACHTNGQTPFACSVYHWDCGTTLAFQETDKARKAADPTRALIELVSTRSGPVQLVAAGYVVVKNCRGGIVAAYRVQNAGRESGELAKAGSASGRGRSRVIAGIIRPFVLLRG